MSDRTWREVNRGNPCPVCGHDSWCAVTRDGGCCMCRRYEEGPDGPGKHRTDKDGFDYWIHWVGGDTRTSAPVQEPELVAGAERADIDTLHRAYSRLLANLRLAEEHRRNLQARGLSDAEIHSRGYRTLPLRGRRKLAEELVEHLGEADATRIPGIYVKEEDGKRWWSLAGAPGLVVPVRDSERRVRALRIRADNPGQDAPKYTWMTSAGEAKGNGPSPGTQMHVPLHPEDVAPAPATTVRLTEGELKADVATCLSRILTLSIPGVGCWRAALPLLEQLQARTVLLAFDADARRNRSVARNLQLAARGFADAGLEVRLEVWPEEDGKGIDDLLAGGGSPTIVEGDAIWAEVQDIADSAGVPVPLEQQVHQAIHQVRNGGKAVAFLPAILRAAGVAYGENPALYVELKRAVGDAGVGIRDWERAHRPHRPAPGGHLRAVQPGEGKKPKHIPVLKALPEAPVDEDLVVPPGWQLRPHQLCRVTENDNGGSKVTVIASAPLLITGRMHDITEGTEAVQLCWHRDGVWRRHTTDRALVAKNRSIVDLAGYGLPVTDRTAPDTIEYLSQFEALNMPALPRAQVSRQMGWQGDGGALGFLCGRRLIRPDGEELEAANLETLDPRHWDRSWIAFRGQDHGEEQLADGFQQAGTFEEWRTEVATLAAAYPRVGLAIYAALTPPLLEVLAARNFIVDWSFSTSTGKTSALRVAASCWGCPDERAPASIVGSWDATRIWIEQACSVLRGMPLILDDTKRAKDPKIVGQVLYDVAMGRGRGRGAARGGTRRTSTWQTVLLSTGEAPATAFTRDGGTVARCLVIWGPPFERADETTAPIVHRLDLSTLANYGHAGPRVVQFLMRHRPKWADWRKAAHQLSKRYLDRAGGKEVGCRLAVHFGTLHAAARVAHAALGLEWDPEQILEPLWGDVLREVEDADRPEQALAYVVSWASANSASFWGRHQTINIASNDPKVPHGGWAGRWDKREWEYLAWYPHRLRELLEAATFDVESVLRMWRDRGWILAGADGKSTRGITVAGHKPRLVCISRQAIERITGGDSDPDPYPVQPSGAAESMEVPL